MHNAPADLLTTREALEVLGYTDPSTISRMVREGRLTPERKLPGTRGPFLFERSEVERARDDRDARAAS